MIVSLSRLPRERMRRRQGCFRAEAARRLMVRVLLSPRYRPSPSHRAAVGPSLSREERERGQ